MDGLATYEIMKTGFALFVIVLLLAGAIGLTIYNINKHYISTTECNVVSSTDGTFTQTVTYTVNNIKYVKNIPANIIDINNQRTMNFAHPPGTCTLYYASADPNTYSLNSNPTLISTIASGVLFVIAILGFLWFTFLRSNKNVAGVMGGIDAAQTVFNFGRRY